ncbi:hypothetical protein ACO0QE_004161 [Hanseniaspora vineae]
MTTVYKHVRYAKLQEVCEQALNRVLKKLANWNKLCLLYPTLSLRFQPELAKTQTEIIALLKTLCTNEFHAIFKERHIREKLNDLDELITIAKHREREFRAIESEAMEIDNENTEPDDRMDPSIENQLRKDFPKIESFAPSDIVAYHKHSINLEFAEKLAQRLEQLKSVNQDLEKEIEAVHKNINEELDDLHTNIYKSNLGDTASTETTTALRLQLIRQLQDLKV